MIKGIKQLGFKTNACFLLAWQPRTYTISESECQLLQWAFYIVECGSEKVLSSLNKNKLD